MKTAGGETRFFHPLDLILDGRGAIACLGELSHVLGVCARRRWANAAPHDFPVFEKRLLDLDAVDDDSQTSGLEQVRDPRERYRLFPVVQVVKGLNGKHGVEAL